MLRQCKDAKRSKLHRKTSKKFRKIQKNLENAQKKLGKTQRKTSNPPRVSPTCDHLPALTIARLSSNETTPTAASFTFPSGFTKNVVGIPVTPENGSDSLESRVATV